MEQTLISSDLQAHLPRVISLAEAPLLPEAIVNSLRCSATIDLSPWAPGQGPITLVIGAPMTALAALLQGGVAPADALSAWADAARSLLGEMKRSDDEVRLVLAPREGGLLNVGGVTGRSEAATRTLEVPAEEIAPWWLVAAGSLLEQDKTACELAITLLDKAGATLAFRSEMLTLVARMQRLFGLGEDRAHTSNQVPLEARLAMTVDAIDRLQAMIEGQAEELAQFIASEQSSARELEQLREDLACKAQVQDELLALKAAFAEQRQKQGHREAVLGARLLDDIAERRRIADLVRDYEDWSQVLQADIQTLRAELDQIYQSRLWKMTSLLRSPRHKSLAD